MTLARLAVLASMVVAAGAAQAQDWKGYWRLDLGGSIATDAGLSDNNNTAPPMICGNVACTTYGEINDVGTSRMFAIGGGAHLSPSTRFDVTLNIRDSFDLSERDVAGNLFTAEMKSISVMLNGYYDFALGWGKPYLGAGVGFGSNKMSSITATAAVVDSPLRGLPDGSKSGFAWSLMAGIGFPMSGGGIIDLGYRYVDLGKIETGAGVTNCLGGATCVPQAYGGMGGNLRTHEFAIGLRY
jgi:opacity protein-like surface antigen